MLAVLGLMAQDDVIKVDVDLVNVLCTVRGKNNGLIGNLEKSKALRPNFMLNYFELARAYHREGQNDRAVALLTQMQKLPDEMYDDRTVRAQGERLLKELK